MEIAQSISSRSHSANTQLIDDANNSTQKEVYQKFIDQYLSKSYFSIF